MSVQRSEQPCYTCVRVKTVKCCATCSGPVSVRAFGCYSNSKSRIWRLWSLCVVASIRARFFRIQYLQYRPIQQLLQLACFVASIYGGFYARFFGTQPGPLFCVMDSHLAGPCLAGLRFWAALCTISPPTIAIVACSARLSGQRQPRHQEAATRWDGPG